MTLIHCVEPLFIEGRTYHKWQDKKVSDDLLKKIYDICKMGPTSTNCCPMRLFFLKTPEAKEKLKECLVEINIPQTMEAPVTAIIAYDLDFYKNLPLLSSKNNAYSWFQGDEKEDLRRETAFRNSTLQGAYFMMVARAYGLDCGPMSGFEARRVDTVFFAGTSLKSNFLCNLGYGDPESVYPRAPRLEFDEACQIL